MEKITTILDGKVTKELVKHHIAEGIVGIIFGLLVIAAYITMSIIKKDWLDALFVVLLALGAIVLCFGILLVGISSISIKKSSEFKRKLVSEFADEYFTYDLYRENEKVEQGKIYYVDLMGYKQTKHYLFLGLKNNNYIGINKVEGLVEFVRSKGLKEIKSFGRKK